MIDIQLYLAVLVAVLLVLSITLLIMLRRSSIYTTTLKEEKFLLEQQIVKVTTEAESLQALYSEKERAFKERAEERLFLEQTNRQQREQLIATTKQSLLESFRGLAAEVTKGATTNLIEIANENFGRWQKQSSGDLFLKLKEWEGILTPFKEAVNKIDGRLNNIEELRVQQKSAIEEQFRVLMEAHDSLKKETSNLVKALRVPNIRGRWGELQLKRVVEIAGMVEYCDFEEQTSFSSDDKRYRPDMIVKVPGGGSVVVDAKVPLTAFLEAVEDESNYELHLKEHARLVRQHINQLAQKAYPEAIKSQAVPVVVMFLPQETFFYGALRVDPGLTEYAFEKKVIVATPATLIAILKSIALSWQSVMVTENAEKIQKLGAEIYDRLLIFLNHMQDVKRGLEKGVDAYNKAANSLESRVLVSARRLRDLGATKKETELEVVGM